MEIFKGKKTHKSVNVRNLKQLQSSFFDVLCIAQCLKRFFFHLIWFLFLWQTAFITSFMLHMMLERENATNSLLELQLLMSSSEIILMCVSLRFYINYARLHPIKLIFSGRFPINYHFSSFLFYFAVKVNLNNLLEFCHYQVVK